MHVSMWSVVTFWDQTSSLLGAGTGRGFSVRVMVSFEASRWARGEGVPLETVCVRVVFVPALVSLLVVSRVAEVGEEERIAEGAIICQM